MIRVFSLICLIKIVYGHKINIFSYFRVKHFYVNFFNFRWKINKQSARSKVELKYSFANYWKNNKIKYKKTIIL